MDNNQNKVQENLDNFSWYYKGFFDWVNLIYYERDNVTKRITYEGRINDLNDRQVILKIIKINDDKGFELLKEPYFLACLKNNRYFIEIVDLFPSKKPDKDSANSSEDDLSSHRFSEPMRKALSSKDSSFFNIILRNEGIDLNIFICYYNQILGMDYNVLIPNISRYIIFQVVCGLQILHQKGLTHNDIKPKNIVINNKCEVKICDLGSTDINNTVEDIGTLGYLSPQAMAKNKRNMEDDMYAVGIVFLELLNRQIGIFLKDLPKGSSKKQLLYIIYHFYDISFLEENSNEQTRNNIIYNSIKQGKYDHIDFKLKEDIFIPNEDEKNKELIKNLLEVNPSKRMKAEEVINLPIFKNLNFEFEKSNVDMKYYKEDYEKYFKSSNEFNDNIFREYIEDIREKIFGKKLIEEKSK